MPVISRKKLKEAAVRHSDLETPLDAWFRIAKRVAWQSLDVRRTFSNADAMEKWTVFNIKGNQYRLLTEIKYRSQRIYIRQVLSHAESSRKNWKQHYKRAEAQMSASAVKAEYAALLSSSLPNVIQSEKITIATFVGSNNSTARVIAPRLRNGG